MKRLVLLCFSWVCSLGVANAFGNAEPVLRTELSSTEAVPGQVIEFELTILVPTWMPKPPELPSFELPDVRVRVPEGASRPAMESIEGETWAGVTRTYELSPMVVGDFRFESRTLTVTYADPETREPIVVELVMDAVAFSGRAPEGAEGLEPFVAADALILEQTIEGDPESLEPGSVFTREVVARVTGASPIFLPPLIPALDAEGLAAYPKEPVFTEKTNRGQTVGERVESVTYVAEAGGRYVADPVRIRWWNLGTEEIEVAEVPGIEIVSSGGAPLSIARDERGSLVRVLSLAAVLALLLVAFVRWVWPRVEDRLRHRRQLRLESEAHAFKVLLEAVQRQELGDAVRALERWTSRLEWLPITERDALFAILAPVGEIRFGPGASGTDPRPQSERWSGARAAFRSARREALATRRRGQQAEVLPALNPGPGSSAVSGSPAREMGVRPAS